MQLEDYQKQILERYTQLSDTQKESVRKFKDTKNGQLMLNLLGPEFSPLLDRLAAPKATGLASRIKT
jgi:hypothetical protein